MTFNSYIFLLVFLPIVIYGYFLINRTGKFKLGLAFLIGMSIWFYGYFNWNYLIVICGSVIGNYLIYLLMRKLENKRICFVIGLLLNIGLLGYFKYTGFFIENINRLFNTDFTINNIFLPLGISFFTFQQISFLADVYNADMASEQFGGAISYSFIEYAAYVVFFPQLVAGPIVTHDALVWQLKDESRKRVNYGYFSKGIVLFTLGLAKKVLIADVFGAAVELAYNDVNSLNSTTAIITVLAYTIQIYFDFSGYSDMAVGLGWMLNVDLPVNFDSPYKALSVTEFWKRWHITLTSFFTKYVYIPLGGSKKGKVRTYINILIVFCLSGFWHGAGWNFVLWGVLHGFAMLLERIFKKLWDGLHPAFSWLLMFGFINIGWVYFRASSIGEANRVLNCIASLKFGEIPISFSEVFHQPECRIIDMTIPGLTDRYPNFYLLMYFVLALVIILAMPNAKQLSEVITVKREFAVLIAFLFVWCIFSFTGITSFIYFNF